MSKIERGIALSPGASDSIGQVSAPALRRDQHVHLLVRKGRGAPSDRCPFHLWDSGFSRTVE